MVTPRAQHVTAVKKHRTLRKRGRYWRAGRLDQPSYEELREAAEDHDRQIVHYAKSSRSRPRHELLHSGHPAGWESGYNLIASVAKVWAPPVI